MVYLKFYYLSVLFHYHVSDYIYLSEDKEPLYFYIIHVEDKLRISLIVSEIILLVRNTQIELEIQLITDKMRYSKHQKLIEKQII